MVKNGEGLQLMSGGCRGYIMGAGMVSSTDVCPAPTLHLDISTLELYRSVWFHLRVRYN